MTCAAGMSTSAGTAIRDDERIIRGRVVDDARGGGDVKGIKGGAGRGKFHDRNGTPMIVSVSGVGRHG